MDRDNLKGIRAEVEKELENLQELRREMKAVTSPDSILSRRSMGSILHDFYNCCERVFRKIAVDINGGYEDTEKWRKGLLARMTIEINGVRPAVLSDDLAAELACLCPLPKGREPLTVTLCAIWRGRLGNHFSIFPLRLECHAHPRMQDLGDAPQRA